MPVAMVYDSLLVDLRRYIERGSVADTSVYEQLPSLVNLAERDIATKLKILGLLDFVTSDLVAGTSVYQKPDRWRSTAEMNFGVTNVDDQVERKYLLPRSLAFCRMYWPIEAQRDEPLFYADYDYSHWLIVPTPVATYPWEIGYYQQPPLLDASNQTNWLTDYAPQALLYGSLVQALPFLKDGPWTDEWKGFYNDQLQALDGQDLQRIIDRTTNRRKV